MKDIFWSGVPSYKTNLYEDSSWNLAEGILINPIDPWLFEVLKEKLSAVKKKLKHSIELK